REFDTEISGSERDHQGTSRTLVFRFRTRERGRIAGIGASPYGNWPKTRNAGRSLARRFVLTRGERSSAPGVKAPRLGLEPVSASSNNDKTLEHCSNPSAAKSGAVFGDSSQSDPRLMMIQNAWPTLPEALRAGILAMIDAARKDLPTAHGPPLDASCTHS